MGCMNGMRTCEYANMRTCGHANMRTCEYANMRTCGHANMRTCGHADMRTCEHANMRGEGGVGRGGGGRAGEEKYYITARQELIRNSFLLHYIIGSTQRINYVKFSRARYGHLKN